jgi:hypothetical protein
MIKLSATDKSGNRGLTGVNSVHRFRAECQTDVDELRQLLGQKIVKITMVQTPPFPDVEVEIETGLTLEELRAAMRQVVDGHVMVHTVARSEEYTSKRDYDL